MILWSRWFKGLKWCSIYLNVQCKSWLQSCTIKTSVNVGNVSNFCCSPTISALDGSWALCVFAGKKPQLSIHQSEGDVSFVCSLPGSVKTNTTCHLYFGEASRPVQTSTVRESRSSKKNPWFCQFILPVDDILKHLLLVQQKDASCDYRLENELNSLSPRSDPRSLAGESKYKFTKENTFFEMTECGSYKMPQSVNTDSDITKYASTF